MPQQVASGHTQVRLSALSGATTGVQSCSAELLAHLIPFPSAESGPEDSARSGPILLSSLTISISA